MIARGLPWCTSAGGLQLQIKVSTAARQGNGVEGVVVDSQGQAWLWLRVRARAVDGQANVAIVAFLAELLECGRRAVSIRSGERSRWKRIAVAGEPLDLARRCAALIEERGSER